jgi:two-component system, NtrC family, response regulator AtoC
MSRSPPKPLAATVLVVDDEAAFRTLVANHLERAGMAVTTAGSAEEALTRLSTLPDVLLLDVHMPGMTGLELVERLAGEGRLPTTIVMSAYGQLDTALAAVRAGAIDFLSKPFRLPEVELKVTLALEKARQGLRGRRRSDVGPVSRAANLEPGEIFEGMVGRAPPMRELFGRLERVARFTSTVLLHGESGTGKELVARALHKLSPRRGGPFVAVNCGAIPENLLESELFGHTRGAFTDANADRKGLFEQAHGGTLFLDEIVDLPLHMQVKLLRVLQEGEVRAIGASRSVTVDVRVVAASAVPARDRVREGRFREDLYYRLGVIELHVPPLRDRIDDIPLLVEHVVQQANTRLGTRITGVHPHALARLMAWSWPGNVRELQNVIEQAAVMSESPEIGVDALPTQLQVDAEIVDDDNGLILPNFGDSLSIPEAVAATERALIAAALQETEGNRTHAAQRLEISLRSLLQKIQLYNIDIPGQVGRPPQR